MKPVKDETLIKKIINKQCSKSLQELVDRHGGMIFNIGKKYCSPCSLDINELNDKIKIKIILESDINIQNNKGMTCLMKIINKNFTIN
jgi:hypothetical protein